MFKRFQMKTKKMWSFATAKLQVKRRSLLTIALVAVIGFAFIACDDGSGGGGGGGGGKTLTSITAVYTPTTEIFPDTTLDTLKEGLTVTAHYSDNTTASVTAYNLSIEGEEFTVGENTVTVTYTEGGVTKTTTFKVTVDVLDHVHDWQLKQEKTAPTCTEEGEGLYECTLGAKGAHTEDLPIAALGHDWNTTFTTIAAATETTDGVEAITCKRDSSHTKDSRFNGEYATGTAGLVFDLITSGTNANTYRVHNGGNKTFEAVHIPAFHRPDPNSPYVPVTEIGNGTNTNASNAFGGNYTSDPNTTLTTITFAANSQLQTIGGYAIANLTSLTSITLPAGLTSIGESAFYNCSLTSIEIPASVTSIGNSAFLICRSLASVTFTAGSQLKTIGSRAFYDCTSLTSITIPASVTSIGASSAGNTNGTFGQCTSLASVIFEKGSQLMDINPYMFYNCSSLASITLDLANGIMEGAFQNCTSLTSITIPTSDTYPAGAIERRAFQNCTSLTSVTFECTISSSYFDNSTGANAAFLGDLRAKFYATDSAKGTPGTYTTTAPVSSTSVWEKQ